MDRALTQLIWRGDQHLRPSPGLSPDRIRRGLVLLVGLVAAGSASTPALAAQARGPRPTASWDSTPAIDLAYLDSTVSPCNDFYQYAIGGWYREHPDALAAPIDFGIPHPGVPRAGSADAVRPDPLRIGTALREFLEATPALARTTTDPTTRLLGSFYGSCLADTTGAAEGAVGDPLRASACLRLTRTYLEPALFTLVLEQMWPADARAQSRTLFTSMIDAAMYRLMTSPVLRDSTKQRVLTRRTSAARWHLSKDEANPLGLVAFLDSIAPAWDRVASRAYPKLVLSPNDFAQNLARLRDTTMADSLVSPRVRQALRLVVDSLFEGSYHSHEDVKVTLSWVIPSRVNGVVDLGGWYGAIGKLLGHEISHAFEFLTMGRYPEEVVAFGEEQLHGQLELLQNGTGGHPFVDQFGVLIAHGAFERALAAQPRQQRQKIDGFTPEQRFFLGIAQGGLIGGAPLSKTTANTPTRWRIWVNGGLSAIPAFAQAFACKTGDPMAGGHVWYKDPWYGVVLTPEQRKAMGDADSATAP